MQGYNRVAAARVRERVRQVVAAGGDIGVFVPVEAVAHCGRRVSSAAIVDRQV